MDVKDGASSSGGSTKSKVATLLRQILVELGYSNDQINAAISNEDGLKEANFTVKIDAVAKLKAKSSVIAEKLKKAFVAMGAVSFSQKVAALAAKGIQIAAPKDGDIQFDFSALKEAKIVQEDMNAFFLHAGRESFDAGKAFVNILRLIKALERFAL